MNTSGSTADKSPSEKSKNEYIILYDQKILLTGEIMKKGYSPLPGGLMWEIYEKIKIIYEVPLSPTTIIKVMEKKTKKIYALKQLNKVRLKQNYQHEFAKNEILINHSMGKLSKLIVQVPNYFEDDQAYYMVMEYTNMHGYFEQLLQKVKYSLI